MDVFEYIPRYPPHLRNPHMLRVFYCLKFIGAINWKDGPSAIRQNARNVFIRYFPVAHLWCNLAKAILVCSNKLW